MYWSLPILKDSEDKQEVLHCSSIIRAITVSKTSTPISKYSGFIAALCQVGELHSRVLNFFDPHFYVSLKWLAVQAVWVVSISLGPSGYLDHLG
jgi:hypothetical protein